MATDYGHLVGHRFRGGTYRLAGYEAWLWADAVGAPHEPVADPVMAYMIGLHGGGASIADIMALLEADPNSGVLFGEIAFEFAQPLRPETTYHVEGEVLAVERKQGRRAGVFDRVRFCHRLTNDVGELVAMVTHVWVFPRQEETA